MLSHSFFPAIAAIALVIASSLPAQAQLPPDYHVQVADSGNGGSMNATTPLDTGTVFVNSNLGEPCFNGRAIAGVGLVQARGFNHPTVIPGFANGLNAGSNSSFTLHDILITGPAGVTSVSGSMNFRVDGDLGASGGPPNSEFSGASVELVVGVRNTTTPGAIHVTGWGNLSTGGIFSTFNGNGVHGNFTTVVSILDTALSGNVFTPVGFSLVIGTGAGTGAGDASSFGDFTVSFPTTGPVFNLPDGFTVNSVDGHIVNNFYVNPVPEPAGFGLSILGCLAAVALRRMRRRCN